MPPQHEELTGTFRQERHRFDSGGMIGVLEDKNIVVGNAAEGELIPGIPYKFVGTWGNHPKYGRQFRFSAFVQQQPHTRHGVVTFLQKFCKGIGEVLAHRIVDVCGAELAIGQLTSDPVGLSAKVAGLALSVAKDAAAALKETSGNRDTKIHLMDIFAGRGFPHTLIEECIKRFGIKAPDRIRRDPWVLMRERMPGCGFLRVDKLYTDFGLPLDRMDRQIMAAWHTVHSDTSGSTWHAWDAIVSGIGQKVTGNVRAEKALKVAVRSGWLEMREDSGKVWLADRKRAENERFIGLKVAELCQ